MRIAIGLRQQIALESAIADGLHSATEPHWTTDLLVIPAVILASADVATPFQSYWHSQ